MKRFISLFLSLSLLISLLFAVANPSVTFGATDSGSCGTDATWSLSNGVFTISGTGATTSYNAALNKAPWTSVKSSITKVVISEGITELGSYSFYNCTNLTSVSFPSTLTKINGSGTSNLGYGAFQDCTSLKTIVMPQNLTVIGNCTFKGCTSLTSISLNENLMTINQAAFDTCTSLSKLVVPDSVTTFGSQLFKDSGIKDLTIGTGLTSIPLECFFGANSLQKITIPENVTSIGTWAFKSTQFLNEVVIENANCSFPTASGTNIFDSHSQPIVVKGHSGSTAQTYVEGLGDSTITFVSIDGCEHKNTTTSIIVEATCTEAGKKKIECKDCDYYEIEDIDALGHDNEETNTIDNKYIDGHIYHCYECKNCHQTSMEPEHQKDDEDGLPLYVWIDGYYTDTVVTKASCTSRGTGRHKCTVSGCSRTEVYYINPTHNVTSWTVTKSATCTTEGSRTGKCSSCGTSVTETIKALGHNYDKDNPTRTVDEDEDGHSYKYYKCSRCSLEVYEATHNEWVDGNYTSEYVNEPTCVIPGVRRDTCSICGDKRLFTEEASGEHTWVATGETTDPGCTTKGSISYECSVCHATKKDTTDALGHDYVLDDSKSVSPTCTTDGSNYYGCSRCSASKTEVIKAPGHTPGADYVVVKQPDCFNTGRATGTCTVCNGNFDIVLEALGHDFVDVKVDLTDQGKPGHSFVTPTCSRCKRTDTSYVSHDEWIDGDYTTTIVLEPSCAINGRCSDKCSICGQTQIRTIEKVGHDYDLDEYDSSTGVISYKCAKCLDKTTMSADDVYNLWNVTYINCVPERSLVGNSVYLDVNNDGIINVRDYRILYMYNSDAINYKNSLEPTE